MPDLKITAPAPLLRRLAYCLATALVGAGSAFVLLLAAGGPTRPAFASDLTYPGVCGVTIQACIDGASAGDTILISAGDYTESLTLSKAVSLTGELSSTTILHALPNTRVLTVTGALVDSSVIISGLTFIGGNLTDATGCPAGCGAGILITGTAHPLLASLLISNNFAGYWGGGLFADSGLDLSDVQFISNTAQNGAGAYVAGDTHVSNGQFVKNTGWIPNCGGFGPCISGLGAGLYSAGTLVVSGTLFAQNAGGQGAGAYAADTSTVQGAVFQANTGYRGAGLFAAAGLALTATQFLSNTADNDNGGGVFVAGPAVVHGGLFQNNHDVQGGGLFADSSVAFDEVQFVSNSATYGGGFFANGAANVDGGLFQMNSAFLGGGGLFATAELTMTGTELLSNTAEYGAALVANNTATLSGAQFRNNGDEVSVASGIAIVGPGSIVTGSSFVDNDDAGLEVTGPTSVSDSSFIGNTGHASGGGISAEAFITVTDSSILSNTGDGLYTTGPGALISGSSFENNHSVSFGYGVAAYGSVTVTNSSFISNAHGGLDAGQSVVIGSSFLANGGNGLSGGSANLVNSHFDQNQGAGAVSADAVTVISSTFSNNGNGGLGLSVGGTVSDSTFVSNTGMGLFAYGPITVSASSFISNTGGGLGAANTALITDSLFMSNTAPGGAGLATQNRVTVSGSRFIHNRATSGGGGGLASVCTFCFGGSTGSTVENSLFEGNVSTSGGADVDVSSGNCCVFNGNLLLVHDTFASPEVISGAAVQVADALVGITDTIIASHTVGIQSASANTFGDNNLFFGNGTNISGAFGGGVHNLVGNPQFVNPAGGDFHLGAGSPAIDAGTNAGVSTDFDGDPRPLGADFDIGFDESTAATFADVGLVKSASAALAPPGQLLTYTLVFSNAGPAIAGHVLLTDIIPSNLVALTYTSSGAALAPVGGPAFAWQVANLPAGAGGVITITGLLSPVPGGTLFTNTATINTAFSDTNPANNTSAVSVTVPNEAPVAAADAYLMTPNSTLTVSAPGLLANDTDGNQDGITATLSAGPLTGTLGLHTDGSFTYTPPLNFSGPVTFTYQASDGLLLSAPAVVTVVVDQPPVADAGPGQLHIVGQIVSLDGSGSSDPDNNLPLAYGWRQTGGAALILSSASISRPTFTAPGTPAVVTFTLMVTDAYGLAGLPATTTITVTNQAISGLGAASSTPTVLGHATAFTASITAGTNVNYAWAFGNGATGSGAHALFSYPAVGAYTAVVTVTNSLGSLTATTTVMVDDLPLAVSDAYSTAQGIALHVAAPGVLANDSDAFPGGLTARLVISPTIGALVLAPSGAFTYTPPLNFSGPVTFTYRASDGLLFSPPATVTITVNAFKLYLPLVIR